MEITLWVYTIGIINSHSIAGLTFIKSVGHCDNNKINYLLFLFHLSSNIL